MPITLRTFDPKRNPVQPATPKSGIRLRIGTGTRTSPSTDVGIYKPRTFVPQQTGNAFSGMMAASQAFVPKVATPKPPLTLTAPASGKGTWVTELKTPFTDALNAGLAEGLGRVKTGFAGAIKMVAESDAFRIWSGTERAAVSKKMGEFIGSTESWIQQYQPKAMTTMQLLAKDLVSGAVSIFSSIGMGLVTGSAKASAALFGLLQAGDKYVEQRKAGLSKEKAGGIASAQGFVEAALEGIGLTTFLRMSKGTVWNTLIRAGTEAVQEASQSLGENILDKIWDPKQKIGEGVLRSALIGGLLGLPAAVAVSSYEQSAPMTTAVKKLVAAGWTEKEAVTTMRAVAEVISNRVTPIVEEAVQLAKPEIRFLGVPVGEGVVTAETKRPTRVHLALPAQISPVAAISTQEASVPTVAPTIAPQIAPAEIVQPPAAQMEPTVSKMEIPAVQTAPTSVLEGPAVFLDKYMVDKKGNRYAQVKTSDGSVRIIPVGGSKIPSGWAGSLNDFYDRFVGNAPAPSTEQPSVVPTGKPTTTLERFSAKQAEVDAKIAPILGKKVKDGGITYQLVGANDQYVPYFSKVTNGKVGKKQITLQNYGRSELLRDLGEAAPETKLGRRVVILNKEGGKLKGNMVEIAGLEKYKFAVIEGKAFEHDSKGQAIRDYRGNTASHTNYRLHELSLPSAMGYTYDTAQEAIDHAYDMLIGAKEKNETPLETFDRLYADVLKRHEKSVASDGETTPALANPQYAPTVTTGTSVTNLSTLPAGQTSPLGVEVATPITTDVPSMNGTSGMAVAEDEMGRRVSPFDDEAEPVAVEETLTPEELGKSLSLEDLIVADAKAMPSYRKATLIGNVMDALEADLARATTRQSRLDIQDKAYKALVDMGIPKEVLKPATLLKKYRELKTAKGLEKFVTWVQQQYLKYDNALMIDDIVSLQEQAYRGVYAVQRGAIEELMKQYRVGRLSEKHRAALEQLVQDVLADPAAEINDAILKKVAELDKTPLRGLDNEALYQLRKKLQVLIAEGKRNYREWSKRQKAEREAFTNQVVAKAKSLGGLEDLEVRQAMSKFKRDLQEAITIDKTLMPMDYLLREVGVMDEKRTIDENYNRFSDILGKVTAPLKDMARDFHLTTESKRRIKIYQVMRQGRADLLAPLLDKAGMTMEQARALRLSDGERMALAYMDKMYERYYTLVSAYMAENFNILLPHVEHYAPLLADPEVMHDATTETNTIDYYYRTKTISSDSLKKRRAVAYLTTSNAFSDFYGYVTDMQYMLNMGKPIRQLFEAVNSKQFGAKAGSLTKGLLLDWVDTMARRGGARGVDRIAWIDALRKNTSVGYMAGKLSSMLIQLTAAVDGFQVLGARYMIEGSAMQMDEQWVDFLRRTAPEVYMDNADPDIDTATMMKWASDKLYAPLIWMDAKVRRTVYLGSFAQWAAKNKFDVETALAEKLTPSLAAKIRAGAQWAMEQTRKVQGTSAFKDQPLAISRGRIGNINKNRSLGKAIMHFQSFNLFRWANIKDTIWTSGFRKGRVGKALGGIFWLLLMAALAETILRRGTKFIVSLGKEKPDTNFWVETMKNVVESVPFIGPAMSLFIYGNDPIPAIQALVDAGQGTYRLVMAKGGYARMRGLATTIRGVGAVTGIPGSAQIGELLKYATNAAESRGKGGGAVPPPPTHLAIPHRPTRP